mmetsp:Transcript_54676/g.151688  ORF Transcript_54676/g.151688 Transcript_54676/m.151688 type:complete len:238 (-) Transcript_54676:535-1248(-)
MPSLAPLKARMLGQSTSRAVTSSAWPLHVLKQLGVSMSHNWRRPSKQPVTARMLSQCTDTARTAAGPPQPKSRTNSPSSKHQSLRPPSLEPERAMRKRGSRVPQTKCTVTPSAGTPWSLRVVSFGMVSAHHINCCEEGGMPKLAASCSFSVLTRTSGSVEMRARLHPRMFRTVTWKPPSGAARAGEGSSRCTVGELVGAVETLLREGFSTPPMAGNAAGRLGTSNCAASRKRAAMKE